MREQVFASIVLPEGLKGATGADVRVIQILPTRMGKVFKGFEKNLLDILGCEELPTQQAQVRKAG